MGLNNLLRERESIILKKWQELILQTYPPESVARLRSQDNQFTNPVGYNIKKAMDDIFKGLIDGMDTTDGENVSSFISELIKIRAVQDFTPSQAISFIFLLKRVVREEVKLVLKGSNRGNVPALNLIQGNSGLQSTIYEELLALESKIDEMALCCFDLYMKCREKIYELKANELRRMTFGLLRIQGVEGSGF